jgi:hypothetical protein
MCLHDCSQAIPWITWERVSLLWSSGPNGTEVKNAERPAEAAERVDEDKNSTPDLSMSAFGGCRTDFLPASPGPTRHHHGV